MADPDSGAGLISGDDALLRFFLNNARFGDDILVSWSAKANTTKYRDDHGGNKRSKVDVRLWGWDLSIKARYKTNRLIEAALAFYRAKQIAGSAPVNMGILIAIQERTTAALMPAYQFAPVVFDFNVDMPGMKERLTQSLDCWAEQMSPATAPK